MPREQRPGGDYHIISVRWENTGYVEGRVRFFVGPMNEPMTYRVPLAKGVVALMSKGEIGHAFVYYPDGQSGKYCGEAIPLPLATDIYYP